MGKTGTQESAGQAALRNLSELEEPLEAPYYQGILTYIKNSATYMSDPAATLLYLGHDTESSTLVLGKDLERIHNQTEASHGRLGKDEDMDL